MMNPSVVLMTPALRGVDGLRRIVIDNWKILLGAVMIMLGGNAGSIINAYEPGMRADSFSGLDAANQRAEVEKELDHIRTRLTVAEIRVAECLRRTSRP